MVWNSGSLSSSSARFGGAFTTSILSRITATTSDAIITAEKIQRLKPNLAQLKGVDTETCSWAAWPIWMVESTQETFRSP